MNFQLSLTWSINDDLADNIGKSERPDWDFTSAILERLELSPGFVKMDILEENNDLEGSLQAQSNGCRFMISYFVEEEAGSVVRTLHEQNPNLETIKINGHDWDKSITTSDFSIVAKCFAQLMNTFSVSQEILS